MTPTPPRTAPPELTERVASIGLWRDADQWVNGTFVSIGQASVTIKTDQGKDLIVPIRRLTWKASRSEWVCWSPQIDAELTAMMRTFEKVDRAWSTNNKNLVPGEYVRVKVGSRMVGGFVSRQLPDGFVVSIPKEKSLVPAAEVSTTVVTKDMLEWNHAKRCWDAQFKSAQTR